MKNALCCSALATVAVATGWADSTVDATARHAYGANIGWLDLQYDTAAPEGVVIGSYILRGKIYGANVGWIDTGSGTPSSGMYYAQTGGEWGVNHDGTGRLSGYAYGSNIGWIVFDQSIAEPPRVDLVTGALSGYAYGANVGWISLSGVTGCVDMGEDADGDGIADAWEIEMLTLASKAASLVTMDSTTDSDGDGVSDVDEFESDTNPFDPSDRLRITSYTRTASTADLGWNGSPRRVYQVETSEDLATWNGAGGTLGVTTATVPTGGKTKLFFRVRSLLPTPKP